MRRFLRRMRRFFRRAALSDVERYYARLLETGAEVTFDEAKRDFETERGRLSRFLTFR